MKNVKKSMLPNERTMKQNIYWKDKPTRPISKTTELKYHEKHIFREKPTHARVFLLHREKIYLSHHQNLHHGKRCMTIATA